MADQMTLQAIVVEQSSTTPNQGIQKIALFNPDGTPFVVTETSADMTLTGYVIAEEAAAVAPTDTVNEAIAKLEKRLADAEAALET